MSLPHLESMPGFVFDFKWPNNLVRDIGLILDVHFLVSSTSKVVTPVLLSPLSPPSQATLCERAGDIAWSQCQEEGRTRSVWCLMLHFEVC